MPGTIGAQDDRKMTAACAATPAAIFLGANQLRIIGTT